MFSVMTQTNTAIDTTSSTSTRWAIDASHTSVGFSVRHMMITNVRGELQRLSGEVIFDPRQPELAKVSAKIEAGSISTREEKRDAHLKSADFFDAEGHPYITFESKRVRRTDAGYDVVGDLTIRGTTREVTLTVDDVTAEHTDPWGGRRIGAAARAKIRRSEFGMTWNAALEAGGVLVGDEISIQIEVSLVKQS
jgi:polyisoprenoid-binding protein YceI